MTRTKGVTFYHTPALAYRQIFHSVVRAGHHCLPPGYCLGHWKYPGHDLMLVMSGSAVMKLGSRMHTLEPGMVAWVDCHSSEITWRPLQGPLEIFWLHVHSSHANAIAQALQILEKPTFVLPNPSAALARFRLVLKLLRSRPLNIDARLHVAVTALLADLFSSRQIAAASDPGGAGRVPADDVLKVLNVLRTKYERPWKMHDLAQLMGLSTQQFFRRFKKATGSSPNNWLRHERINQAKRQLAETSDRIASIAINVGYCDCHYFSRDFKKLVGISPRQYRLQAHSLPRKQTGDTTD